eukprot:1505640-Rhodomonas_salina.3
MLIGPTRRRQSLSLSRTVIMIPRRISVKAGDRTLPVLCVETTSCRLSSVPSAQDIAINLKQPESTQRLLETGVEARAVTHPQQATHINHPPQ